MKKFELYERKDYYNLYYLQDIVGDFYYFNSLNEDNEFARNHFIKKIGLKNLKRKIRMSNMKLHKFLIL